MPAPKDPEKAALWRQRMSEARRGKKHSAETRAKMSVSQRGKKLGIPRPDMQGANNPMRRPEIVERVAAAHRGRPKSPEQRVKIAATLRGRKLPEEVRAKLRKDVPGYKGAHFRVRAKRGRASTHPCVECGEPALDWALVEVCMDYLTDQHGRRYSLDVNDYEPMCHPCHMTRDDTPFAKR